MNYLDWLVLILTTALIVIMGTYAGRNQNTLHDYLKGGDHMKWFTIGLSVMATQASAITFISTPGLAFDKGMSFVQNYFGLPIALVVISAFFIPVYYRLKVFTAYEYLEHRFDLRLRLLTASLFLLQRGLASGITIYAPAIVFSITLGWDLTYTIIAVGILVIIYTASGGSRGVSLTQKWQMLIILLGMAGVLIYLLFYLTRDYSLHDVMNLAGNLDKMKIVTFSAEGSERYTFWTGIGGGFILALSYFGTDQSQVQRYLGGRSMNESKAGLMFNAIAKVPMQFMILLCGVLVFLFFQFNYQPLLFNPSSLEKLRQSEFRVDLQRLEIIHLEEQNLRKADYASYRDSKDPALLDKIMKRNDQMKDYKEEALVLHSRLDGSKTAAESDYVFLHFILNFLPHGLIGLLICVILFAAMSSTSGEINALAATTVIDFYGRLSVRQPGQKRLLLVSKLLTVAWGLFAILFALFANMMENLIEAVNILGSLFYGTILGIFLTGLFTRKASAASVFYAALMAELTVLTLFFIFREEIAYLWHNLIGCALVFTFTFLLQLLRRSPKKN